jgi:hypothetical protein
MLKRNRLKQAQSFKERPVSFATDLRDQAAQLPAGVEREDMLRRARRANAAAHLDWANSPGLQPSDEP